jgi:hypothetical protein
MMMMMMFGMSNKVLNLILTLTLTLTLTQTLTITPIAVDAVNVLRNPPEVNDVPVIYLYTFASLNLLIG